MLTTMICAVVLVIAAAPVVAQGFGGLVDNHYLQAQDSLDRFRQLLAKPPPSVRERRVLAWVSGIGGKIDVWVTGIVRNGDDFRGVIANEPFDGSGRRMGEVVEIPAADVLDWRIVFGDDTEISPFSE